jgi:Zn-dependent peptidase ImmA (M78 family)
MLEMPEKEYGLLEFHANEFAGRLLVPIENLKTQFAAVLDDLESNGFKRQQLSDEHVSYLCVPLARHFAVSQDVMERRLSKEKLWPLS